MFAQRLYTSESLFDQKALRYIPREATSHSNLHSDDIALAIDALAMGRRIRSQRDAYAHVTQFEGG